MQNQSALDNNQSNSTGCQGLNYNCQEKYDGIKQTQ